MEILFWYISTRVLLNREAQVCTFGKIFRVFGELPALPRAYMESLKAGRAHLARGHGNTAIPHLDIRSKILVLVDLNIKGRVSTAPWWSWNKIPELYLNSAFDFFLSVDILITWEGPLLLSCLFRTQFPEIRLNCSFVIICQIMWTAFALKCISR